MDNEHIESIFSWKVYLRIFLSICFMLTISLILFFRLINSEVTDYLSDSAYIIIFGNICFLTFILTLMNGIHRKFTVEKPVKKILKATEQIAEGNFHISIQPRNVPSNRYNEFDLIIENLNVMAKELESTEILRHDFISNVSHEFKSPLAAIQNYSVLLQDTSLSEEKRAEYVKAVNYSCIRLTSLINNILKLNKLENQQIFQKPKKFDLSEQLCTCMLGFETIWDRKNINISTDIDQDIFVKSDEELLSLVWNNLLSNALKFTDGGGTVLVSLKKEEGKAVVRVADTGCGIEDEKQKHIFEKFYQADSSHAVEGNGLGLSLVKAVLDKVGGEITMKSELGKGTEFTVKI